MQSINELCEKGNSLSEVGMYQEALSCFKHALEITPETYEIDIKLGHSVWEVKPGYSGLYRFDSSLKKYIDPNQYTRYKRAENYKFKWYDVNKNVPGFAFTSSTASMLEISRTYRNNTFRFHLWRNYWDKYHISSSFLYLLQNCSIGHELL